MIMAEDKATPIYNIKAAVKLTNVPACTLRSWESRYGIIKPARHPNGYRLYSEKDVEDIIWLRDKLREGLSIAQASALLEQEHAKPDSSAVTFEQAQDIFAQPGSGNTETLARYKTDMLQGIKNYDEARIERIINEAFSLFAVEQVCLELFEPVMYEVGELWAKGEIALQTEHFATGILRNRLGSVMHTTISSNGFQSKRPLIVTGCAPNEDHELGILTVSLFLRRLNYRVIYLGQNVSDQRLTDMLIWLRPSLVCFSASTVESARNLVQVESIVNTIRKTEKLDIIFAFGGRIFSEKPELREQFHGVYLGDDADQAAHTVHELLG